MLMGRDPAVSVSSRRRRRGSRLSLFPLSSLPPVSGPSRDALQLSPESYKAPDASSRSGIHDRLSTLDSQRTEGDTNRKLSGGSPENGQ